MALGMALRYVLEALRKPHNSKMYMFGIAALDKFKLRLKDFAQYCTHVASIPHFKQFPEHLIEVSILFSINTEIVILLIVYKTRPEDEEMCI